MKRPVQCINTGIKYESVAQAERELGVYNITYNAQGKINYVYKRNGNGAKVFIQFRYLN